MSSSDFEDIVPKDAAGLVLLRRDSKGIGDKVGRESVEVLLGRRASWLRFMPGFWVVPGGRYDPIDDFSFVNTRPESSAFSLSNNVLDRLMQRCNHDRAQALARTSLRELWEETGILAAQRNTKGFAAEKIQGSTPIEMIYRNHSQIPALAQMDYIAQAITPPGNPARFDTRFFALIDVAFVSVGVGDGELEDLNWYPLDKIVNSSSGQQPLAGVTRLVLRETQRLLQIGQFGQDRKETPNFTKK